MQVVHGYEVMAVVPKTITVQKFSNNKKSVTTWAAIQLILIEAQQLIYTQGSRQCVCRCTWRQYVCRQKGYWHNWI